MSMPRSPITQALVNAYPPRSDIRNDEQSLGSQLFNIIGNSIQDMFEQVQTVGKNYATSTANTKDLDLVYKFQLPGTFTFTNNSTNELIPDFQTPSVAGRIGSTWHEVALAKDNDIEAFWYDAIPNRFTFDTVEQNVSFVDDNTLEFPGCILAQATVSNSPFDYGNSGIPIDTPGNKLWIEVSGGTQYLNIDDQGVPTRGIVTITGITRQGETISESIIFLHDDILQTQREYRVVLKVEVTNIYPNTANIRLFNNRFGTRSTPRLPPSLDWYNLATDNETKQAIDTFWDIDFFEGFGMPLLQLKRYVNSDIRDRLSGFVDKEIIQEFCLFNSSDNTIDIVVDCAVEPFSNRIWVVDNNNLLHLFNNELTLPDMSQLDGKDYDAMSVIEPSRYHALYTESVNVEFNYICRRPILNIVKHRVSVVTPSGLQSIIGGEMVTYTSNSWVTTTLDNRHLRPSDTFSLEAFGDWVFILEVMYSNGITEVDKRIVSVDIKDALADYDLSVCTDGEVIGIDFDADQNLIVCTHDDDDIYRRHTLKFHTDTMLMDTNNKVLIFKEPYDQVRIDI